GLCHQTEVGACRKRTVRCVGDAKNCCMLVGIEQSQRLCASARLRNEDHECVRVAQWERVMHQLRGLDHNRCEAGGDQREIQRMQGMVRRAHASQHDSAPCTFDDKGFGGTPCAVLRQV